MCVCVREKQRQRGRHRNRGRHRATNTDSEHAGELKEGGKEARDCLLVPLVKCPVLQYEWYQKTLCEEPVLSFNTGGEDQGKGS